MSDFSEACHSMDSPRARPLTPSTSTNTNTNTPSTPSPRSPASPVPNFTPSPAFNRGGGVGSGGLSRSLSTTNLSSSSTIISSSSSSTTTRAPKGLMQKFIASRGKMTGSAFSSPPPTLLTTTSTTSRGIPTRPMRVEPKAAVVQRESLAKLKPTSEQNGDTDHHNNNNINNNNNNKQQHLYRRSYCTAEEKIQSELKEMQMREEELRRLRARQLAQSQPNLVDLCHGADDDQQQHPPPEDQDDEGREDDDTQDVMNGGLRSAQSNPNLLDQPDHTQVLEKGVRRRSALIAQWENRIQQTTDT
ncbi:hypothetical protein Pcinc_031260 [Petrolisthes cinctipes]|uniref:A-kinase anchor protein 2 C-terminal domain-containing protein n=1 Tax=Petrolisthes cinctipes TaxID=88211 RepID=A0AAE1K4S8_PETCI|nr:hypothetical protein Pcinc_031260 [Petrolisthes cinctipes]